MARLKHGRLWIALGLIALVGVFVVGSLGRSGRSPGTEVRLEPLRRDRVEAWVRAPGQVRAERYVQISSNIMGRVKGLAVAEGDRVAKGDLLLRLDDERYRSTFSGMQAQVDAAEADLRLAEAQRSRSRQNLARQEKLFTDHLLSEEGIEAARAQASIDDARYESASEGLQRQKAILAEAKKDLSETVFLAPIAGIVTELNVEEGENVVTGTMNNAGTVILTLADLDTMEVEADVDETDVVSVKTGQSAKVKVDAWEDSVLTGAVTTVGMSGRRGTQGGTQQGTNFEVKVRIDAPPAGLRPGMSADIEVLTGERDSALVVPIQALVAQPERVVSRWMEAREKDALKAKGKGKARFGKGNAGKSGKADEAGKANPSGKDTADRTNGESARSSDHPDRASAGGDEGDTTGIRNEKRIEGIFVEKDGKARFVPVKLGLRGDTHIEIAGDVTAGQKAITGPYRVLRTLKDGDAVKLEKAKKTKGKKNKDKENGAA